MSLSSLLVGVGLGLLIELFNLLPHFGIKFLNLSCSFLGFLTKLSGTKDRNKIKGSLWVVPIHYLEG